MRWDLILPGLSTLLASLTGLQVSEAFVDEKATRSQLKGQLKYNVISCTPIERAEIRYVADTVDPNKVVEVICFHNAFTLSVRCEGYSRKFTQFAPWHLERIATRMNRATSRAAVRALGCAWIGVGPTVDLSAMTADEEPHFQSVGVKDFMFTGVVNDKNEDDAATDTIATVELASHYLYGVDGVQLPSALQVSETIGA